jgi:endoglucanase
MTRREFLLSSAAAAAGAALPFRGLADPAPGSRPQPKIPRWRGFNLQGGSYGQLEIAFKESDFELMAGWGFNFARLPLAYWSWASPKDWKHIDGDKLKPVDQAIEWGRQYGVYVNLCVHRIPGYCVNGRELEPYQLFDSPRDDMLRALDAATYHWTFLSERYRDIPSSRLSFDLFNEPPFMKDQSRYVEIARALIAAIRGVSPDRLITADGADLGQTPVLGLVDEGIVQSTRGYLPKMISHYTATWVPPAEFESLARPTWPMRDKNGVLWDKEKLRAELITTWKPLTDQGVPIHVGEWGCWTKTPRQACIGWMTDLLSLWKEAGWGWSMWNLRGGFGILDSDRVETTYEDYKGHKLDREMLELLLAH